MLEKKDLTAIRDIVKDTILEDVPPIVNDIVDEKLGSFRIEFEVELRDEFSDMIDDKPIPIRDDTKMLAKGSEGEHAYLHDQFMHLSTQIDKLDQRITALSDSVFGARSMRKKMQEG